jgi:outer membrane protein assembly factor BamB
MGPVPIGRNLLVGTAKGQLQLIEVPASGKLRVLRRFAEVGTKPVSGIEVAGADTLFFTVANKLHAFKIDGTPLWDTPFTNGEERLTAPVISSDPSSVLVYVGTSNGYLLAIERETGKVRWTYEVPSEEIHVPAMIVDDELYVVGKDAVHILSTD